MDTQRLRFPGFKSKAFTLSYDDGSSYDKRLIELVIKHNLKITFNIPSGIVLNKESKSTLSNFFKEYKCPNIEIAGHGLNHGKYDDWTPSEITEDVLLDKLNIEKYAKERVIGFAYPYGDCKDPAPSIVANCGYLYARNVQNTETFVMPNNFLLWRPTCHHNSPKLFDLAEQFINLKSNEDNPGFSLKLFYVWGHSHEFNRDNNWDRIEKLFELIANKEDIWYATNGEICDYVMAFNSLQFSSNMEFVYNPSSIKIYLHLKGKNYIALPGKKTILR